MTHLSLSHGRAPRPLELLAIGLPLAVAGLVGLIAMLILGGAQ